MGHQTVIVYGYGFKEPYNEEKIIDFIKNHKDTFCKTEEEKELFKEMLNYTEGQYDLEDFFDGYACEHSGMEGIGAIVSNVMSRETGIRFCYQRGDSDCDSDSSILLTEKSPWEFSETEKNLTKEKLHSICSRYMEELGIESAPEYLNVEYCV